VKREGFAIRNPVDTAILMYEASKLATEELVQSMVEGQPLNLEQHKAKVKEAREKARFDRATQECAYLKKREEELGPSEVLCLQVLVHLFSSWLNEMDLSRDVFRDNTRLHMNWMPEHLPWCCNGFGAKGALYTFVMMMWQMSGDIWEAVPLCQAV
jgi:hypothetical protein